MNNQAVWICLKNANNVYMIGRLLQLTMRIKPSEHFNNSPRFKALDFIG